MPAITVHPEGWKEPRGYANAMLAEGRVLFIGGQIGWTGDQVFEHKDFLGQLGQALRNIRACVEAAGGTVEDLTRLTWFVTDKRYYADNQREVGKVYRDVLGYHFPAMTMVVVADLIEDEALVEIEATAVLA